MPRKQKIGDTSAVRGDDANQDLCGWCGDGGELICCEGCPAAYHRECVNVKEIPLGEWYCGPCLRARRLGIPRRSIEGEIDDVLEEGVCHICGGSSEDTFQPCTCQLTVSSSTARPNKTYIDEGKVTGAYIHVGSRYQADIPALLTSPPFPSPSAPPPASPSASPQILPSPISSAAIASLSNPPRSCSSSSPSPMLVCQESSSPEPVAVPMQKQADTDADAGAGASSAKSKPKPSTASSYDAPILLFDPRQALTPSYYTLDHFLSLVRRIGLELDEDSDSSSDIAMMSDFPVPPPAILHKKANPARQCVPDELALLALHKHRHNVQSTMAELDSYPRSPESLFWRLTETWTSREISLFEDSIRKLGRNFQAIQRRIQSKSVRSIVGYYYHHYKKSAKRLRRHRTTVERPAHAKANFLQVDYENRPSNTDLTSNP